MVGDQIYYVPTAGATDRTLSWRGPSELTWNVHAFCFSSPVPTKLLWTWRKSTTSR